MSIEVSTDIPAVLKDYDLLNHKPQINGVTLEGNMTSEALGLDYIESPESGGSSGQILKKTADGEEWADEFSLPADGSTGQILKKTADGEKWADEFSLPADGSTGQILKKTASGEEWADDNIFLVQFTGSLSPSSSSLTSDKTFAEILAAKQAGKFIIGRHMGMSLYLDWLHEDFVSRGAVFKSLPVVTTNGTDYYAVKLTSDGGYVTEVTYVNMELKYIGTLTGASVTLADRTEYRGTDVTELAITYPTGNFECWLKLTFAASGTIAVTFPQNTQYIGTAPAFANGEVWEVSIKDGVAIAAKVGDGT